MDEYVFVYGSMTIPEWQALLLEASGEAKVIYGEPGLIVMDSIAHPCY
jgi:hypothetical protein